MANDDAISAALQSTEQDAIARLREQLPLLYDDVRAEAIQEPTALDEALHHLDETVRLLTADTGLTNDRATVSLLLAYASTVASGKPDLRLLSLLGTHLIGPAEAQTAARATVSWTRGNFAKKPQP